jgi:hypothetical protein
MELVSVMSKPKKKAGELTTDEALKRLFGKKGAALLKRVAEELDEEKANKRKKKADD